MTNDITLDVGPCSVLIICSCGWRDVTDNRRSAWLIAARHLKDAHGDLQAGWRARHNAYMIDRRTKEKEKKSRGQKRTRR